MPALELAARIARLRQGTVRLRTTPGATVHLRQQRHAFEFGTPLSSKLAEEPELAAFVAHWFNAAVVPVKWMQLERAQDQRDYRAPDGVLDWCGTHDFAVRGHCLFYAHRIHVQEWVKELPRAAALRCMERHARETVRRYADRIVEYDLNNELLDGCWYRQTFGDDIIRRMADWVLEEKPDARLYVNEHDIVTGGDIDRYMELIDHLLTVGVPIRGIGVQGHLDPPFNLSHVSSVFDRLAQFDLPVKVTEFDAGIKLKEEAYRGVSWIEGADKLKDLDRFREIVAGYPSDFEERKAAAFEGFFQLAFAHPAVQGLYIWGFQEGHHWRTRGESFRRDLSPLPAGEAFCRLLRQEWWTDTTATAGEDGFCAVRAFYGSHEIEIDGHRHPLTLTPDNEATVLCLS